MKGKKNFIFVMFCIISGIISPVVIGQAYAQDSLNVIILSPQLGAVIHKDDRELYKLFEEIELFDSAYVYKTSIGNYYAHITATTKDGHPSDTILAYDEIKILRMAEKIDHRKEIHRGTYVPLLSGPGREIIVWTNDGGVSGELLSVRPDELLLSPGNDIPDDVLAGHPEFIKRIPISNIRTIYSEGRSNTLIGLAIGSLVGVAVGAAIGKSESPDDRHCPVLSDICSGITTLTGAAVGMLGGMAVGTIIGTATSRSGIWIEHPDSNTLLPLKDMSRYPKEEPEFLKALK